ncbi:flagellin [Methylobacter sp. G7]|uniref:flagellin N-terminal helical domain-containing protein n=1 Tax=Methylobacter sp. G7 TaxID=3230117 RepID=UPI003D80308D
MVINTNISALNSQRQLNKTNNDLSTSMERLSSGLRVNSAKDDAAGLAISNRMTSQIRGMTVATRNANDGISLAQTAEAAMGTMTETMQRMRDLAVQSANDAGVTAEDRSKLQEEFGQLNKELSRIITNTEFNGKKIINGSLKTGLAVQVGANTTSDNQIKISIDNLSATIATVTTTNLSGTASKAIAAITALDGAIKKIDTSRAKLGAIQNRFTTTIANLQSSIENQSAARSRITDTDFAMETANLSRNQILQQAGTAMLAQANQSTQSVLKLLQ